MVKHKLILFSLLTSLCLATAGCANVSNGRGGAAYDSEILYVCDNRAGEWYYLFFQDGVEVAMDAIEYAEMQQYADSTWWGEVNSAYKPYLGTIVGSNKEMTLRQRSTSGDNQRIEFYETLLGRCMPFNVVELEGRDNAYMGESYETVLQNLKESENIISVQELKYPWSAKKGGV